ncbi:lysophosphatidic acid receptor 4-like isoform 1-T2 [Discoglossus pictus]
MFSNNTYQGPNPNFYTVGYATILILGFILNVTALCLFIRLPQLKSPTSIYMKNLICSDLLLIFTLPVRIYYHYKWSPQQKPVLDPWLCEAAGAILLLNMYGSIFFLTCISLDRCLAVCFPLRTRLTRQKAPWVCAFVWGFNIISCISTYIHLAKKNHNHTCFEDRPPFVTMLTPTVAALIPGFLIPLSIMATSSVALLRAVGHSKSVQEGIVNNGKIVRMLVVNLTIFLLCFLPYHTVILLYQVWKSSVVLNEAYKIALLMACFNAVLDPLVYYFAVKTFQKKLVGEKIRLGKGSDQSSERVKRQNPSSVSL